MLEILGRERNLNVARNFLFSIEKRSNGAVKLEDRFFNSLIRSFGQAGLFEQSMKLFQTMKGYCMKQEIDEALVMVKEMTSRGLKLNKITYNTLIKGLCEARKLDKIKDILEGIIGDGEFSPDTCTFNTLIHAHCCAGNLGEAFTVFEKMKNLQVPADSATYSVLLCSLCQRGDYDRAEMLFDELSEKEVLLSSSGSKPLAAAYNPMFQHLCEHGKTKKAERVFRQLMKRGTQDPPSYKLMIMGHCKEGAYESGYELLTWMLRQNFIPDIEIYDSLIDGFLQKDRPLLAKETLEKC
ncbi:pentatricopeptide repeat-containing protein [Senna tora]|uniref:Pentatricopeptide repeat-containing protein n=1 Tax=Senna tora TaxID=362788 RepID=A0A834XI89_9FABA|nr:pentatricopeptide repeat-containing protein [Senna tora]